MKSIGCWRQFLPVLLLLTITALILEARDQKEMIPAYRPLSSFQMDIADWQARDLTMAPAELAVLGPGDFLLRDYLSSTGEPPVNLYIAFYPSQRAGDTIHSPKDCLPGSGWTPLESGRISLRRADGSMIVVNRYVVAKSDLRDLVLYWYQAHGRVTPSEYWAKIFLVTDAIRMNRTDGALVRVVTPINRGEKLAKAEERAVAFSEKILALLDSFIPE